MNLAPCFHEPALLLTEIAADELDGVDREDTDVILIVRMEVRSMVGRCRFGFAFRAMTSTSFEP